MASSLARWPSSRAGLHAAVRTSVRRPAAAQKPPPRRASSTTASTPTSRLKVLAYSSALAASLYAAYMYVTDTRASVHRFVVPPALRVLFPDAEDAHHFGVAVLRALHSLGLHPRERGGSPAGRSEISIDVFGQRLCNPIGISAGLDKHAEIPDALFELGAAVVEVGGCTPRPQEGNARPRVFRVPAVEGMINRYGLNSVGADSMAAALRGRLRRFARKAGLTEQQVLDGEAQVPPGSLNAGRMLAVQIAKNKDTDERDMGAVAGDYAYCVQRLGRYADVLVVNVSSPNTPGLRDLQAVGPLTDLLSVVVDEASRTGRKTRPKVMVKVSPDEDEDSQIQGIAQAVCMSGVDGVIVGNTTKKRTGLVPERLALTGREQRAMLEQGGFSGPAMFGRTLSLVGRYRAALNEESLRHESGGSESFKVIFATGGIADGEQALRVLEAGASLAMVYTALVYGGVGTVTRIKGELKDIARTP